MTGNIMRDTRRYERSRLEISSMSVTGDKRFVTHAIMKDRVPYSCARARYNEREMQAE